VRTEPLFSSRLHDVFFNRGWLAVSISATFRKPDQTTGSKKEEALQLTRDLDEAILRFIKSAQDGDILAVSTSSATSREELKAAIDKG